MTGTEGLKLLSWVRALWLGMSVPRKFDKRFYPIGLRELLDWCEKYMEGKKQDPSMQGRSDLPRRKSKGVLVAWEYHALTGAQ